jgi:hypothetical protein
MDVPGNQGYAGGYLREQILSITMFQLYQALWGDSAIADRRRLAARFVAYLIIEAIRSQASNGFQRLETADSFELKLREADTINGTFPGKELPGTDAMTNLATGAAGKVVRWSFVNRGLQILTGAEALPVDVYINDGRGGDYKFTDDFSRTEIWNRLAPSPGGSALPLDNDEPPNPGVKNFIYVRINNLGPEPAENVTVSAFSRNEPVPGELDWDGQWTPLPLVPGGNAGPFSMQAGSFENAGPFEWIPGTSGEKVCVLMSVNTKADPSNIEPRSANAPRPFVAHPIPLWWLVPFDNNLATRTFVVP